MMNLAWTLLFVNWLLEWDMKRKFALFGYKGLLHYALVLFLVTAVWLIWSDDTYRGLDCLRQTLPLLAIPLVVLTSRPLNRRQWYIVAIGYIGTLFVVTVVGLVRWLTIPDLPYRQTVPYISHIRFSLNICLAICIMMTYILSTFNLSGNKKIQKLQYPLSRHILTVLSIVCVLWFLSFLFLLQSYTGLIVLVVTAFVSLAFGYRKIVLRRIRLTLLLVTVLTMGGLVGVCAYYVGEYYTPRLAHVDKSRYTLNGNPYSFAHDGLVECGRCVNDFVCESELREQWLSVSNYPIDSLTSVGYPVYPALVRYLNAMGVSKDSVGVACLTSSDVAAIEQGIANPIYTQESSLRRMIYVMLYEYENYRCFHTVKGFTMLQRIELWQAACTEVCKNWLHGVGTGDVEPVIEHRLQLSGSPLVGSHMYPHNQYLSHAMSFGVIAFALLCAVAVWAFVRQRLWRNTLWVAAVTIFLLSCLTEDTLFTSAGAVFSALWLSLLSKVRHLWEPQSTVYNSPVISEISLPDRK